jgi:hypothetical protein
MPIDNIGINPKNKKKIKDATAQTNIHSLLNILKANYTNVHQDKPRPATTDGADRLQLSLNERQTLGKRPAYEAQRHAEPHTHTPPTKKRKVSQAPQPQGNTYHSLIPQIDYTEGPTSTTPPKPARTLLAIPIHQNIPSTHSSKRTASEPTMPPPHEITGGVHSPKKTRTEAPRPYNPTQHTHPTPNGTPPTRKRPS